MSRPDAFEDVVSPLPRACGAPRARGRLRVAAEDFRVDEHLPVTPDGKGEHVLLRIRKTCLNTQDVVARLARLAGVKPRDVGFAGQKDRIAVTSQWFSVWLVNRPEPDWTALNDDRLELLEAHRHGRKLRRGALRANRFSLVLRDFGGDAGELAERIERLQRLGMPNYFGAQRFGRRGSNLQGALRWFREGRRPRQRNRAGMMLSAARSLLFNQVLAERVRRGDWASAIPGDYLALDGSHAGFVVEQPDEVIARRLADFDLHPSGPLPGDGPSRARDEALAVEQQALAGWDEWRAGLAAARVASDRRPLRARVSDLEWAIEDDRLRLSFTLPRGSFATALVRELVSFDEGPGEGLPRPCG